ncbi:MAG: Gfo/Idh/MocA family oxidoreductase [Planctomycetota bacterium]
MVDEINPVKTAIIGLGRSGWGIHINRMRTHPGFRVSAVTDPLPERMKEAESEFHCATFGDYRELLKKADAELVVVATPSHTHVAYAVDALKSGRNVLVEKPVADKHADGLRILSAARKAGKHLFIHQNNRFIPEIQHLKSFMDGGLIGRVFEIKARSQRFAIRNDWQTLKKYGGGLLPNNGTHLVDQILYLLGSPVKDIWCDLKLVSDVGDVEDHVKILLRAENGVVADVEISTSCAIAEPAWTLLGNCGTLVCDGESSTIKFFDPARMPKLEAQESLASEGRRYTHHALTWDDRTITVEGEFVWDFYENVYEVMRKGGQMRVTPESALETLRVLEIAAKGGVQDVRVGKK